MRACIRTVLQVDDAVSESPADRPGKHTFCGPLTPDEQAGARDLLSLCRLPTEDLHDGNTSLFICGLPACPDAVIGLEAYERDGLLRSLAVRPSLRGSGIAGLMVGELEAQARAQGITTLWLLTESAESFFRRHNYEPCKRAEAPPSIQRTRQFAGLCPDEAACLTKRLV